MNLTSSTESPDQEERSIEITPILIKLTVEKILTAQEIGDIVAQNQIVTRSNHRGIEEILNKVLSYGCKTQPIFQINDTFPLPSTAPDDMTKFLQNSIQHPALYQNDLLELVNNLRVNPETAKTITQIILGQRPGKILCRQSLHDMSLHTFCKLIENPKPAHMMTNSNQSAQIKMFIISAMTKILKAEEPGKIISSNQVSGGNWDIWVKTIKIDYQDNCGLKQPLHLKATQKIRPEVNINKLQRTDVPFKHEAYPLEGDIAKIIEETNINPKAKKGTLEILCTKRTGIVHCTRDIQGNLFTAAYASNSPYSNLTLH